MKILSLALASSGLLLFCSTAEAQQPPQTNGGVSNIAKRSLSLAGTGFRKTWNGARAVGIAASHYRLHGSAAPVGSYPMNPYQPMQPLQMSFPTTSTGNIFGCQNIYNGAGTMTTTSKNIFGGQNVTLPNGEEQQTIAAIKR